MAYYTHTFLALLYILVNIFMMLNSNIISVQAQTRVGFYSSSCPRAESDPTIAPGLLIMHFHASFVQGCDASILIDGTSTEKTSIANNLIPGYEVIDDAKTQLEAACPNIVSCADILAIAARDSVVVSGGASWSVPTDRLSLASETAELHRATDSIQRQIQKFDDKGLNTQDLVTLVGAHTIDTSACQFFNNRLCNFNGTGNADPTINPTFLTTLQNLCPENGDRSRRVALDTGSETRFDQNSNRGVVVGFPATTYTNLRNGRAVLESDQKLWNDATTQTFVRRFSGPFRGLSGLRFSVEFGRSMVKMSNIEMKTGTQGEIRRICSAIN
ncbi:hypothetical protein MKW92_037119 [Papaver armeniacum]|nr:hypothetical protein MKW92_037119 [Papaver armeniacum]